MTAEDLAPIVEALGVLHLAGLAKWAGTLAALLTLYRKAYLPVRARVSQLIAIAYTVEKLAQNLAPNGGASMRDAVDRIERNGVALAQTVAALDEKLERLGREVQGWQSNDGLAHFKCDGRGDCIWVNPEWCRVTGFVESQALGQRWANAIHSDDREDVERDWLHAIEKKRDFRASYRIRRPSGRIVTVQHAAQALIDEEGELVGYVGTLMPLSRMPSAPSMPMTDEDSGPTDPGSAIERSVRRAAAGE